MAWRPKKQLEKISHAQIRCMERYGLKLSLEDLQKMQYLVGSKQSMFVRHEAFCEVWDVYCYGRLMRVVFQPEAHKIMTFLPPDRVSRPTDRRALSLRERLMTARIVIRDLLNFKKEEKPNGIRQRPQRREA